MQKERFNFKHFLLLLLIISEPYFSFLLFVNSDNLSYLGFFKVWDIPFFLLFLIYIIDIIKGKSENTVVFNKYVKSILFFIIFYILYTFAISHTSNLIEAFKTSRVLFYVIAYFFVLRFVNSVYIFGIYINFFRIVNVITFIIFLFELNNINIIFYPPWSSLYPIPRIYFGHYIYIILILLLYFTQMLLNYKGNLKIKNYEAIIASLSILVSLARNLWIGVMVAVLIILLIGLIRIYSKFSLVAQIKYVFGLVILIFIIFTSIIYSGFEETFLGRITGAQEDINRGEGTFTTRLNTLEMWMNMTQNVGLEYTGLGFAHSSSNFISSKAYLPGNKDSWGTEMGIGMFLLYFGYIGTAIWTLLFIFLIAKMFRILKDVKNDFVFAFGLSLSVTFLIILTVTTWAGISFLNLIAPGFLLGMFQKSIELFEKPKLMINE